MARTTTRPAKSDPLAFDEPLALDLPTDDAGALREPLSQLVSAHPDGVGTPELAAAVGASHHIATKALLMLEKERHVYSRPFGKGRLWYPNGRLIHPYLQTRREMRGRIYQFMAREGRSGPTLQILERSFSLLHGERTEGSIFVDIATLDEFIDGLADMRKRFASHEENTKR